MLFSRLSKDCRVSWYLSNLSFTRQWSLRILSIHVSAVATCPYMVMECLKNKYVICNVSDMSKLERSRTTGSIFSLCTKKYEIERGSNYLFCINLVISVANTYNLIDINNHSWKFWLFWSMISYKDKDTLYCQVSIVFFHYHQSGMSLNVFVVIRQTQCLELLLASN